MMSEDSRTPAEDAPAPEELPQRTFRSQVLYRVAGRLHFTCHESDEVTLGHIRSRRDFYFFSSRIPEVPPRPAPCLPASVERGGQRGGPGVWAGPGVWVVGAGMPCGVSPSCDVGQSYLPFALDFGPNDISDVVGFCKMMTEVAEHPSLQDRPLVFYTSTDPEHVTNSVFLLCCFLVLELGVTPEQAEARFSRVEGLPVEGYRDASTSTASFRLSILACLRGLRRAIDERLFCPKTLDIPAREALMDQPAHDITKVSPKFVMFATPKRQADEYTGARPVEGFARHFAALGVTDVVRLNDDRLYDDRDFTSAGFRHHPLEFEDCTCPPLYIVSRFLDLVDAADGLVAVHCLAGLGRTGTLVACHMIKNNGFSAQEAIGFLRLMRPGSIIGSQQEFLQKIERAVWDGNTPLIGARAACLLQSNSEASLATTATAFDSSSRSLVQEPLSEHRAASGSERRLPDNFRPKEMASDTEASLATTASAFDSSSRSLVQEPLSEHRATSGSERRLLDNFRPKEMAVQLLQACSARLMARVSRNKAP